MIQSIFNVLRRKKTSNQLYDVAIACILKDENKYVIEWINYHLKIGVEHFFIYDNGSTIPVVETIKEHDLLEYTTVISYPGKSQHINSYKHCLKHYGSLCRWIAFIDLDEFIVPKNSTNNLPTLLKEYEGYGGLGINWYIFGSSGQLEYSSEPVVKRFTLRSDESFLANSHIKSIVQPKFVKRALKSHCFLYKDGYTCVNEDFQVIQDSFSPHSCEKIQLNHYYCRSLEEYSDKIRRGISDTKRERKLEEFYYHDRESNKIEDYLALSIYQTL